MNVAVLYGGKSSEHEVSLLSASAVVRNIASRHKITLIGITKKGRWFLQSASEVGRIKQDSEAILAVKENPDMVVSVVPGGGTEGGLLVQGSSFGAKTLPVDVAFPVLHGTFGEDGTVQGLLETAGIPYVGGGVMASSVAMDKEKTKQIWLQAGLPVVPFLCVRRSEYSAHLQSVLAQIEQKFEYPVFVKPCCAGSSVGATKAEGKAALEEALAEAFRWDDKVLVELCVDAREIECSVTGNDQAEAYTPGEIVPSHAFYDYDAKYTDPNGAQLLIPAQIDEATAQKVRETALAAYRALDLAGLSRVDFFISKSSGELYLNEVNTIPGFTSISMFSKMCAAGGLEYPQLIEKLLELAVERAASRSKLRTSR